MTQPAPADAAAMDFDLFVIGGGSGGVRAARIAAGHGARVGIAESSKWGGTCVNLGCVPKKLMVQAAEFAASAADSRGFGWNAAPATHDWPAFIAAKDAEIARLNAVYVRLLEGAGVTLFEDHACFIDSHTLLVGAQRITAAHIIIATGGRPAHEHIPGAELAIVSDAAFHLPQRPARVVMAGGGYIAVEFAGIFAGLGSQVEMVMRPPWPLRGFDDDLRHALAQALEAGGIKLHRSVAVSEITAAGPEGQQRLVHLSDGSRIETDLVFLALGRVPNTRGLDLQNAGVALSAHGAVVVDAQQATSCPHIYAIGDVTEQLQLTPVAIAEGHMLADRLFGPTPRSWSFQAVPTAVFSQPPMATVGLTEAQAVARGQPADIYLTEFIPMRHSVSKRGRRTLMKLVVDQASGLVLGAHMLGDDAPEIIQGLAVAITAGATKADFDRTIGIHPTAAEEFVTMRTRTRVAMAEQQAAKAV